MFCVVGKREAELTSLIHEFGYILHADAPNAKKSSIRQTNMCFQNGKLLVDLRVSLRNSAGRLVSMDNHPIDIEIKQVQGCLLEGDDVPTPSYTVAINEDLTYRLTVSLPNYAKYTVSAKLFSDHIRRSPFPLTIDLGPGNLLFGVGVGMIVNASSVWKPQCSFEQLRSMNMTTMWASAINKEDTVEFVEILFAEPNSTIESIKLISHGSLKLYRLLVRRSFCASTAPPALPPPPPQPVEPSPSINSLQTEPPSQKASPAPDGKAVSPSKDAPGRAQSSKGQSHADKKDEKGGIAKDNYNLVGNDVSEPLLTPLGPSFTTEALTGLKFQTSDSSAGTLLNNGLVNSLVTGTVGGASQADSRYPESSDWVPLKATRELTPLPAPGDSELMWTVVLEEDERIALGPVDALRFEGVNPNAHVNLYGLNVFGHSFYA